MSFLINDHLRSILTKSKKEGIIVEYLAQHIEGLIFTSERPLSLKDIKLCLEETFETEFEDQDLESAIEQLMERYRAPEFSFEVLAIGGGYQFLTKGAYHQSIGTLLRQSTKKRLSRAALETLSIIAYKQPVTKGELEKIRGVSCDYAVQKLLEKELVTIIGRSESPGRPLLYGTSEKFMDYFGLSDLKDLPKPKDFKIPDSEVGEVAPIEEALPEEVVTSVGEDGKLEEAITVKIEENGPGEEVVSGETTTDEESATENVDAETQEASSDDALGMNATEEENPVAETETDQEAPSQAEQVSEIVETEMEDTTVEDPTVTYEASMTIEQAPEPTISEAEMLETMEKEAENLNTDGIDIVGEEE